MSRYKQLISPNLSLRDYNGQVAEALAGMTVMWALACLFVRQLRAASSMGTSGSGSDLINNADKLLNKVYPTQKLPTDRFLMEGGCHRPVFVNAYHGEMVSRWLFDDPHVAQVLGTEFLFDERGVQKSSLSSLKFQIDRKLFKIIPEQE